MSNAMAEKKKLSYRRPGTLVANFTRLSGLAAVVAIMSP
jgi:hypothetical protein